MTTVSKRTRAIRSKVDTQKTYPVGDALSLVKQSATAKFDESVDVSVSLGIDAKKSDQTVRGSVVLPAGSGKTKRVAVFAQGAKAEEAKTEPAKTDAAKTSTGHTAAKDPKKEEPAPAGPSTAPPFSKASAISALGSAASQAGGCKKAGGPTGTGKVQVTFAPSGRVTSATVMGSPFAGTAVGGCVAGAFRRAKVPAFSGNPVTVSKSFAIN